MQRQRRAARPNAAARLEEQGLSFHGREAYWQEEACYQFSSTQIERLESATATLHEMSVEAVQFAVRTERLGQLQVPQYCWNALEHSLRRNDFSLYGRLDLAYDGNSAPKLLEYNADTPTALLESAVCQWTWLEDCFPECDQFNSLHERLIARWRDLPGSSPVHVASVADHEEDWVCATYLMDTITQAGRTAQHLAIEDLGWDGPRRRFVDLQGHTVEVLFKLYPWEWMLREPFGPYAIDSDTRFIEPLWKSLLSCKGLLALLWDRHPGHENLLPTFLEPGLLRDYAKKPLYSREGANVTLVRDGQVLQAATGPYGAEGYIYQALNLLPNFDGFFPVIGSWVVAGEPAGMGIREDRSPVTTNTSQFVPHYIC